MGERDAATNTSVGSSSPTSSTSVMGSPMTLTRVDTGEDVDEDVEQLGAYPGQTLFNNEKSSSIDDEDPAAKTEIPHQHPPPISSRGTPFWKRYKLMIVGAATIIFAVVLIVVATMSKGSSGKETVENITFGVDTDEIQAAVPTGSPSASPTVIPNWDINYLGLDAGFSSNTGNTLTIDYEIGNGKVYESELLAFNCTSQITGISPTLTATLQDKDDYHQLLTLKYDLELSDIAGSNIWDETNERLQLCQILRLIYVPSNWTGTPWIINKDTRTLDIDIDFTAGFGAGQGFGLEVELEPSGPSGNGGENNGNGSVAGNNGNGNGGGNNGNGNGGGKPN